jgi:uridylate kinase
MPAPRRPVVISVGGSVLLTGKGDLEYLQELAQVLRVASERRPLAVVVGGGRTARDYIALGRSLGLNEIELDELGIDVTRLHARLLASLLSPLAPPHPPITVGGAVADVGRWSIVVMGGTEPGHTTDGVATLLAERLRAERIINATGVPGIFDKDPLKYPDAKRIPLLDVATFRQLVAEGTLEGKAGANFPFDRLGAERIGRAKIPLAILNGRDLPQLRAAIEGKAFEGTLVQPKRG